MARVPSRHTKAELGLRRALWHRGLRFRLHYALPGTPDLVFVAAKVAVFVDGCFWHGCALHYTRPATNTAFWDAKLLRNRARDSRVDGQLANLGWQVLRFWTHEVNHDLDSVVERLASLVEDRRP